MVPTFIADRSTGAAPSFSPAASPQVRRRPSSWPPRRPRNSDAGVAHPIKAGVHCTSAHIHQVGADAALEGVQPLVRFRCTFPSRLPDPGRLAVPTRPVVVGAAPIHTLRFQGRTAPSFSNPLRRAAVGSLTPLGQSTPRGALRARSATGQVAGAATEQPGARSPSSKRPAQPAFSQKAPSPSQPNLSQPPDVTRDLREAVSCHEQRQRRPETAPPDQTGSLRRRPGPRLTASLGREGAVGFGRFRWRAALSQMRDIAQSRRASPQAIALAFTRRGVPAA
jgi:hypothetical protein